MFKTADEAVKDLKSGSTILSAGFGLCGTAGMFPLHITFTTSWLMDNLIRDDYSSH